MISVVCHVSPERTESTRPRKRKRLTASRTVSPLPFHVTTISLLRRHGHVVSDIRNAGHSMGKGRQPMEIPLSGRQWTVVDLQGNELKAGTLRLTERPVYFVAQESDGKEYPW